MIMPIDYDGGVPILVISKRDRNCRKAEYILNKAGIFYMKTFGEGFGTKLMPRLIVNGYEYEGLAGVMRFVYGKKGWIE